MNARTRLFCAAAIALAGAAALSGCRSKGEIVVQEGVGVTAVRGACPAVGVPDYTGDVTLFRTPGARDAASIDVTAAITNLRSQCDENPKAQSAKVYAALGFDVLARRSDARGSRQVSLPYFITVLRGGRAVVTKRVGTVVLHFADGQERAQAHAQGGAYIDRAEATLPEDIRRRIVRKRKAGDQDAAIDPLTEPEVRAAVQRSTFEVLVGFQLDQEQLAYNATR
jgi:hypothetical protein